MLRRPGLAPSAWCRRPRADRLISRSAEPPIGLSLLGWQEHAVDHMHHAVAGDHVGGDKIGGSKVGGDLIDVGGITDAAGVAIGKGIEQVTK